MTTRSRVGLALKAGEPVEQTSSATATACATLPFELMEGTAGLAIDGACGTIE